MSAGTIIIIFALTISAICGSLLYFIKEKFGEEVAVMVKFIMCFIPYTCLILAALYCS